MCFFEYVWQCQLPCVLVRERILWKRILQSDPKCKGRVDAFDLEGFKPTLCSIVDFKPGSDPTFDNK